jgi:protein SCO1/2
VPRWALALGLTLSLSGACAPGDESQGEYSGRNLPYPLEKPDFTFTDATGRAYDFRRETEGFVTLLFFGYTHCPDVCPIQLANIGAVLRDLPAETARQIKVVFVTTDPDRDTPERIREWLGAIHPAFVGLRGPLEQVHAAEASLLLPSSVVERPHTASGDGAAAHPSPADSVSTAATGAEYAVGHASAVVAFTSDGLSRVMYSADTRQQDWRRDLPRLVAAGP